MIRLERVVGALPDGLAAMRAEAGAERHTMLDTLIRDWDSGWNRFDRPGEALVAAYVHDELAGIGGISLDPIVPGALRMRRFYVGREFRRAGIGRALALALLNTGVRPVVANAAAGSEIFWEALGFVPVLGDGHTHILR